MRIFIYYILAVLLILFGRSLFWLLVAAAGFVAGFELAAVLLNLTQETAFVIALVAGAAGALLAIFFQWSAVMFAGFLGGGYLALSLLSYFDPQIQVQWLVFFIGACAGLLLAVAVFNWAIIVLSSLLGAGMIIRLVSLKQWQEGAVFIALSAAGIIIQSVSLLKTREIEKNKIPPLD